jgi:hypothetical protein
MGRLLAPLPKPFDDFGATMATFERLAEADNVDLALPEPWKPE